MGLYFWGFVIEFSSVAHSFSKFQRFLIIHLQWIIWANTYPQSSFPEYLSLMASTERKREVCCMGLLGKFRFPLQRDLLFIRDTVEMLASVAVHYEAASMRAKENIPKFLWSINLDQTVVSISTAALAWQCLPLGSWHHILSSAEAILLRSSISKILNPQKYFSLCLQGDKQKPLLQSSV